MTNGVPHTVSRAMWEAVERFHGLTYVATEVREEGAAAGLKGFWMNYFATRVAPLGPVGPEIVQSIFFYYGPSRIERALPDAWSFASPADVLAARYRGMSRALTEVYGSTPEALADVVEAAALVREASSACSPIGRVLHAGWNRLPWPDDPLLALWHGCTLLREYRSGNHLIAVCSEGLDGCEAVVSHVAVGGAPREWIRDEAGWTSADEEAAVVSLQSKSWLDDGGLITADGVAGRGRIEAMTDRLDLPVWEAIGVDKGRRLFEILAGLASSLPPDDQLDWREVYRSENGGH